MMSERDGRRGGVGRAVALAAAFLCATLAAGGAFLGAARAWEAVPAEGGRWTLQTPLGPAELGYAYVDGHQYLCMFGRGCSGLTHSPKCPCRGGSSANELLVPRCLPVQRPLQEPLGY